MFLRRFSIKIKCGKIEKELKKIKKKSNDCVLKEHICVSVPLTHYIVCSIGGESLAVAQNTYAVKWFQGRELNMVFGLQLSFSRVVINLNKITWCCLLC